MGGASVRLEAAMLTHEDVKQAQEVLERWREGDSDEVTLAVEAAWEVMDQAALEGLLEYPCEDDPMLHEWEAAFDPE